VRASCLFHASILCEQYTFCDRRFLLNFIAQRNLARVRSLAREATDSGRALLHWPWLQDSQGSNWSRQNGGLLVSLVLLDLDLLFFHCSVCLNMCVCDCVVRDAWRLELWSVTEHCYAVLLPVGPLGSCFLTAVCRLKFAWICLNIWENNNIYAWICCCWNLQMNGVFPGFWKFGSIG